MTTIRTLGLVLLLNMAFSFPAYAYLDPGSGAFLLQVLIAIAVGGLVYIRRVRDAVKNFFRISGKKAREKFEKPETD